MKKYISAILCLSTILLLISCNKEEKYILNEVSQDVLIYNQIDVVHNHSDIIKMINSNISMTDFCKEFGINQYKSIGNIYYTILKTTNGLFMVSFDIEGANGTIQQISFSHITDKANFLNLEIGMTIEDVKNADPNGKYEFLLHSSYNYPRISYHYFEDGNAFAVKYEEDIIANIVHFTL